MREEPAKEIHWCVSPAEMAQLKHEFLNTLLWSCIQKNPCSLETILLNEARFFLLQTYCTSLLLGYESDVSGFLCFSSLRSLVSCPFQYNYLVRTVFFWVLLLFYVHFGFGIWFCSKRGSVFGSHFFSSKFTSEGPLGKNPSRARVSTARAMQNHWGGLNVTIGCDLSLAYECVSIRSSFICGSNEQSHVKPTAHLSLTSFGSFVVK
mmetsp:Transcript_35646/g.41264  ORF Transcript_35646/g.41264 Transcript_35646/m.41264 type:complete len:207 (+) Transcript_35646:32-652(+)